MGRADRPWQEARAHRAFRFCAVLLVAGLLVASGPGVAGDLDVAYGAPVAMISEGVTLRYGKSTDIPYRIETRGDVLIGSEPQTIEMAADVSLSTRVDGNAVVWDVRLTRLVDQSQELKGGLPIVEINRETDRTGLGKDMRVSFPLLEARSGAPIDPNAAVHRRFSDMLIKQTGMWQPLPSDPIRSGQVLMQVEADSLLGEPSVGMNVEGTIVGTVKGVTQFLDREAVLVEMAGSLALRFSTLVLPGRVQGYRLLDLQTALPLEAKATARFSGDADGQKISIQLTRTLTISDQ